MATAFQNRLVGTIIIVALAVIFLPELLDGEKRRSQDRFETIPDRPLMKEVIAAEDFPFEEVESAVTREVEIVNESPVDQEIAGGVGQSLSSENGSNGGLQVNSASPDDLDVQIASGETASRQQNTSQPADRPVASEPMMEPKQEQVQAGWVVQLGSFRHQKNVRELLRKLDQAGYRTFTRPVKTSSGSLTKVFVGPDLDQSKMKKAVPHLKEVTGLQGRLTPFTVE